MATERDELLDHEYDGIREYDNPLPKWWLWLFYGTIVFAVIYTPYYLLGYGPTQEEEYEMEMAAAMATRSSAQAAAPQPATPEEAAAATPGDVEAGATIFATNCLPCHGDKGQGIIGPNLTDNAWIHGNTVSDMILVINNGVPEKGMISWKTLLNPDKIRQVALYVDSLQGSNPPNPKAPEGQVYPGN